MSSLGILCSLQNEVEITIGRSGSAYPDPVFLWVRVPKPLTFWSWILPPQEDRRTISGLDVLGTRTQTSDLALAWFCTLRRLPLVNHMEQTI